MDKPEQERNDVVRDPQPPAPQQPTGIEERESIDWSRGERNEPNPMPDGFPGGSGAPEPQGTPGIDPNPSRPGPPAPPGNPDLPEGPIPHHPGPNPAKPPEPADRPPVKPENSL